MALRSTEILTQTPQGLYCPLGDFHIDPVRPVDTGADHPWPFRSRPLRPQVRPGDARNPAASWAVRYGEDFAGRTQAAPLREDIRIGDVDRALHARRPRAGLGPDRHRGGRDPRSSSRATTSARRDPTCLPYRGRALRRVHHRGDLRPAGLPPPGHAGRGRASCSIPSRCFPSAPTSSAPMRSARRSGSWRCCAEEGYDKPIYLHGAMERLTEFYKSEGVDLGRHAEGRGRRARRSSAAPSWCARPPRSRISGRAAFPTRSRASPPAGCGCARGPGRRASSCPS